ncbi:protein S40-7-like [Syzygium oleosum]|uniref:protein S40-7-like n=1 Tax=Syzygium oleosum TaxID=219896 RepID=UPI0024B8BEC6|nr:protein S40-7-like [Syzygium oleosum]
MGGNGPARLRRGKSFSAERLLGALLPHAPPPRPAGASTSSAAAGGDELDEDDVFWTGDFAAGSAQPPSSAPPPSSFPSDPRHHLRKASPVGPSESFGVLAALPENEPRSVFNHKASISSSSSSASSSASSSRMISIPTVPKPPPERLLPVASFSSGSRYHRSAPVNVPAFPPTLMLRRCRELGEIDDDYDDDDDGDGAMLPPHEIVARSLARSPMIACSVLEGAGRTLKGRDLRQVRNAIFRQTGFLD